MFFIRKDKLEEDIEKIREYTIPPEQLAREVKEKEERKKVEKKHHQEQLEDFSAKDVFAMTVAILQVLLPYFLLVFGIAVLLFYGYYYIGTH